MKNLNKSPKREWVRHLAIYLAVLGRPASYQVIMSPPEFLDFILFGQIMLVVATQELVLVARVSGFQPSSYFLLGGSEAN